MCVYSNEHSIRIECSMWPRVLVGNQWMRTIEWDAITFIWVHVYRFSIGRTVELYWSRSRAFCCSTGCCRATYADLCITVWYSMRCCKKNHSQKRKVLQEQQVNSKVEKHGLFIAINLSMAKSAISEVSSTTNWVSPRTRLKYSSLNSFPVSGNLRINSARVHVVFFRILTVHIEFLSASNRRRARIDRKLTMFIIIQHHAESTTIICLVYNPPIILPNMNVICILLIRQLFDYAVLLLSWTKSPTTLSSVQFRMCNAIYLWFSMVLYRLCSRDCDSLIVC